jgi:hypothetical protein
MASTFNAHLLVEGKNDDRVIQALCQHHNIPELFDILPPITKERNGGGVEALLKLFRLQLKASDKRAIGIVLDANHDIEKRWRQVTQIVEQSIATEKLPLQPQAGGLIVPAAASHLPRVGIWLMPDNQALGMLEDFVAYLIPDADQLRPHVDTALAGLEAAQLNRYKQRSKAFIHTWLAWQEPPGLPMGAAITAKSLSADSPQAQAFVIWLNRLFNVPG